MIDDEAPLPGSYEAGLIDPADLEADEKARVRKRIEELESRRFWRGVFNDPVGRREMWTLLNDVGTFQTKFMCTPVGFPDPNATWFEAGKKSVGEWLMKLMLRKARAGFLRMQEEFDPEVREMNED